MGHPYDHARSSAKRFGGKPEDYQAIHDWFDATKELIPDWRHRALRHHSQGIFEAERVFGAAIQNSAGKMVPVRIIGEQHVREDFNGFIPTPMDWFRHLPKELWMQPHPAYSREFQSFINQPEDTEPCPATTSP